MLKPLFQGQSDVDQFELICSLIGTPTKDTWSDVYDLPSASSMLLGSQVYNKNLRTSCSGIMNSVYIDILERILVANPGQRSSARLALGNRFFFRTIDKQVDSSSALRIGQGSSFHEYQTKKRKFQEVDERKRSESSTTTGGGARTEEEDCSSVQHSLGINRTRSISK